MNMHYFYVKDGVPMYHCCVGKLKDLLNGIRILAFICAGSFVLSHSTD